MIKLGVSDFVKRWKQMLKLISFVKFIVQKIWKFTMVILVMLLNPKFLLCFGLGWIITNGWSYVLLGAGIWLGIDWMVFVASGYLAFLWVPGTPEKILTFILAIFFLKLFFPNDEKTLGVLKDMLASEKLKNAREKINKKKKKLRKKYGKRLEQGDDTMYETVILGCGYFSLGYAYSHDDTLIIEETQLADPHYFGTLEGFGTTCVKPTSVGGAALFDAFGSDGVLANGKLAVNELEPALCRFVKGFEPEILLGSFCTDIKKTLRGYDITFCNNEGLGVVSAKRVIDTRQRGGNRMNLLLAVDESKRLNLENVSNAFYDNQKVWSVELDGTNDINEAKSRIIELYGDSLREAGARIITTSYRMFGEKGVEPYTDETEILKVNEIVWNDPFEAFEKGELLK